MCGGLPLFQEKSVFINPKVAALEPLAHQQLSQVAIAAAKVEHDFGLNDLRQEALHAWLNAMACRGKGPRVGGVEILVQV